MIQDLKGAIIADFRGSTGNLTASKNSYSSYFKVKIIPPYVNTAFTLNVRNRFSTVSKRWSTISESNRQTWRKLANKITYSNKFADIRKLNAMQLFVKHNMQSLSANYTFVNDAPGPVVLPRIIVVSATLLNGPKRIELVLSSTNPNYTIIVYATIQQGVNAYSVKGKLKKISTFVTTSLDSRQLFRDYRDRYSNPLFGDNILLGYKIVNSKGQSSILHNIKLTT